MEVDELRERVAGFSRWHYEFDLGGGVRTPIRSPTIANRHAQRKRYVMSPLVELCGGSLAGKRVLDLGCNAGFWSLAAIEAGADFVHGIDGRQMHVDQANLVFEAKGVESDRYRFELSDVFELDLDGERFDIVFCLGLLYHVSRPFELIERISGWNTDLLVIDTTLDRRRGAYFKVVRQHPDDPRSALGRPIALLPTSRAVVALARAHGYSSAMLRPDFTDWGSAKRYRDGSRRAFICAKQTPLEGLDAERPGDNYVPHPHPPPPTAGSLVRAAAQRARRSLRRRAR